MSFLRIRRNTNKPIAQNTRFIVRWNNCSFKVYDTKTSEYTDAGAFPRKEAADRIAQIWNYSDSCKSAT
jgi:hypothetical protein